MASPPPTPPPTFTNIPPTTTTTHVAHSTSSFGSLFLIVFVIGVAVLGVLGVLVLIAKRRGGSVAKPFGIAKTLTSVKNKFDGVALVIDVNENRLHVVYLLKVANNFYLGQEGNDVYFVLTNARPIYLQTTKKTIYNAPIYLAVNVAGLPLTFRAEDIKNALVFDDFDFSKPESIVKLQGIQGELTATYLLTPQFKVVASVDPRILFDNLVSYTSTVLLGYLNNLEIINQHLEKSLEIYERMLRAKLGSRYSMIALLIGGAIALIAILGVLSGAHIHI